MCRLQALLRMVRREFRFAKAGAREKLYTCDDTQHALEQTRRALG